MSRVVNRSHVRRPSIPLLHVTTREEWRAWLDAHHATDKEIWLVSYKRHTGKLRVAYDDAVEEALCFGWIDSLVRRLDDERMAQKFTPRKAGSGWSPSNVARFQRLVAAGRMTAAGLAHEPTVKTKLAPVDNRVAGDLASLPAAIARGLKRNPAAWKNFLAMTHTQRGLYVRFIDAAKREETRARRLADVISRLEKNQKPSMT
jgi:uncharacterized protein YdeI (YjbR/CyaY-like superfamily)